MMKEGKLNGKALIEKGRDREGKKRKNEVWKGK